MSDLNDDPYKVAEAKNLDCVEPGPQELFIDLDDDYQRGEFETNIVKLREVVIGGSSKE